MKQKKTLKLFLLINILLFVFLAAIIKINPITADTGMKNNITARLENHVRILSEDIGNRDLYNYDSLVKAAKYIENEFTKYGYTVSKQKYTAHSKTFENIITLKTGTSHPRETIIIGAHYDSCFNPGADDNASAVAGMLEIARTLRLKKNKRTIKYIAFVNEEPPFFKTDLMGSRVYTLRAKKEGEIIKTAIILEMIGYYTHKPDSQKYPLFLGLFYPEKGNFITIVGNLKNRGLVQKFKSLFSKNSSFPVETLSAPGIVSGVDFSDHWSFWEEGYPAVMITDTAFYRNPNYHKQTDTWDTLDYSSMEKVVKGLSDAVYELSNEESLEN